MSWTGAASIVREFWSSSGTGDGETPEIAQAHLLLGRADVTDALAETGRRVPAQTQLVPLGALCQLYDKKDLIHCLLLLLLLLSLSLSLSPLSHQFGSSSHVCEVVDTSWGGNGTLGGGQLYLAGHRRRHGDDVGAIAIHPGIFIIQ